jgi:hypothetical protein
MISAFSEIMIVMIGNPMPMMKGMTASATILGDDQTSKSRCNLMNEKLIALQVPGCRYTPPKAGSASGSVLTLLGL